MQVATSLYSMFMGIVDNYNKTSSKTDKKKSSLTAHLTLMALGSLAVYGLGKAYPKLKYQYKTKHRKLN